MANSQPAVESAAEHRRPASPAKKIGLAATTGIAAKALALGAQVLAVAIAVRALGVEGFALYVVIASLVSWIGLAGLGVAPGLTLGVARASALEDRGEEARLFMVALVLMGAVAAIVVGSALLLSATGLVEHLTADWLHSETGDASAALLCMASLIALQLVVVVPEAAQLGLQTQYVSNLWAGIGSAVAIVAMLTVGGAVHSVTLFVLISQGPQVAARAANGVSFVLGRRFILRPAGVPFRQYARPILGSGLAFAGFSLASYVGLQVGLLVMAATVDARSVALAGVIVRGHLMQASGLSVVTTPTWPAIANAVARGDMHWVRRTYRVLALGGLVYSAIVAGAILFGLEALIGFWTGTRPPEDAALRALLATYVVVNGWGHVNAMTLVGLGAVRFTAIILVAEAAIALVLQVALVPIAGVTGYVAALLIGAVTFNCWTLALRVRRELAREAPVKGELSARTAGPS